MRNFITDTRDWIKEKFGAFGVIVAALIAGVLWFIGSILIMFGFSSTIGLSNHSLPMVIVMTVTMGLWPFLLVLIQNVVGFVLDRAAEGRSRNLQPKQVLSDDSAFHIREEKSVSATTDRGVSSRTSEPLIDEKLRALARNLNINEGTAEFSKLRSNFNVNYEIGMRQKKINQVRCALLSFALGAAAIYFAASVIIFWAGALLSGGFALNIIINQLRHPLFYINKLNNGAMCVWCGSLRCDLVDGRAAGWYWRHRNKDRSRDKRYKNNYQLGFYYSTYDCRDCDARTECTHDSSQKPSVDIKVWNGRLIKEGLGVRASADFKH